MNSPFIIRSPRLELVAGNQEMVQAEISNLQRLSELLSADFSHGWPPPENDETTMEWFLMHIFDNPEARGWLMWYFILNGQTQRTVIGCGGFTGMPDTKGVVECGYSILPDYQNMGYATEALEQLVQWAFSHKKVNTIVANTLKDGVSSAQVLEKNGFSLSGENTEQSTNKFELHRIESNGA